MAAMDYIAKKNKKWGLIKMSQESLTWIFFLQCFSLYPLESNLFFREEEKNDPEHFYSLSKYTLTQAAASILLV